MSKKLIKSDNKLINFDKEEIELIKNRIAPQSTEIEFKFFLYDAQSRGLNPLKNQIYWIKRGDKATHQVGIDGYRIIAQRTGEYQGQTKVEYGEDSNGKYAEVGIWRKGFKEPVYGRAYLNEYIQGFSPMWKKMPQAMLAKCAESLALRKAFPDELSGLYTNEEMAQADNIEVHANTITGEIIEKEPITAETVNEVFNPDKTRKELNKQFFALWKELADLMKWKNAETKRKEIIKQMYDVNSLTKLSDKQLKNFIASTQKKINDIQDKNIEDEIDQMANGKEKPQDKDLI